MAFSRGGVKIHEFSTKITVCVTPLAFLKKGDEKQISRKITKWFCSFDLDNSTPFCNLVFQSQVASN